MEMIPDSAKEILRIVKELAPESYLVGGAVRDHLMGRPRQADLDVAVKGNGLEIARRVVERTGPGATLVPLDSKRFTGRVALRSNGILTIDVSALKGETIYDDLRKRDFTINSVAIVLDEFVESGQERVVDPLGGRADAQNRIVKASSADVFLDDPLRILRAFRFAAALDFRISPDTLKLIPTSLASLPDVSSERVRDELIALLAADKCFPALRSMDEAGVFDVLFPELAPMKGCSQNDYHHLDVWNHSLETVRCLEEQAALRFPCFDSLISVIDKYLSEQPVTGRPRTALLKLAAIFHDSGKPETRFVDAGGRVRFFGHEKVSEKIFSQAGARLKLATREMTIVKEWILGHMRPMVLNEQLISKRAAHRLHRRFRAEIFGLLLLHLADLAASRGPARTPEAEEAACNSVSRAIEICSELEKSPPTPLLRGRDLMSFFGLEPGPQLGRILNHLAELQSEGEIASTEEAMAAVRKYLSA